MPKQEQTLFEQIRKEQSVDDEQAQRTGWRKRKPLSVLIFVVSMVLCALCFPFHLSDTTMVSAGYDWNEADVIADFPFVVYKPTIEYRGEMDDARENTPAYFTRVSFTKATQRRAFRSLLRQLQSPTIPPTTTTMGSMLSEETLRFLVSLPLAEQERVFNDIVNRLIEVQDKVYKRGFSNIEKSTISSKEIIVQLSPTQERVLMRNSLLDSTEFRTSDIFAATVSTSAVSLMGNKIEEIVRELAFQVIAPNLLFSKELTEEAQERAALSVPRTLAIINKDETIVQRGQRVTESVLRTLQTYHNTRLLEDESDSLLLLFLGHLSQVAVIYALFILYLVFIRPMFLRDNLRLLVLNGGIVAIAVLGLISRQIDPSFHPEYIIVVPVFAMLLAILFDARTSFYVIVTTALLVMGITGNDFQILLGTLLSGTFTIYTIRDLRGRTQIFKSIASIFIGYSLPVLAFGLSLSLAPIDIAFQLVQAGANAVLCPLIVLGLLFVIEHTTSITTDLRLQEYDNLSHPLLVQLSDRAPGTYQHTLSVARLAESAAQAIGANSQLVKIGAYFHDIGKMTKAEYFVENQLNIGNKHDRLSPQKSTAVIKSHVTLGLELAKEYKLPERIIDFIPMHHGTTLIRYFYVKALEKAEQKGGEEAKALIKEEDFRYAGPVPASKEAAILMLADGVEAVSHTMDTSNKDALEKMVDGIARERLLDGQFDNCDLSLKELATVKRSLVKNLLGMGHHRVQYKEIPKMAPQKEHNGEQKPQATPQART